MYRRRKINVHITKVVGADGYAYVSAKAVYQDRGVTRQRTFRHPDGHIACDKAKTRLLDALEAEGIDPGLVETERALRESNQSGVEHDNR